MPNWSGMFRRAPVAGGIPRQNAIRLNSAAINLNKNLREYVNGYVNARNNNSKKNSIPPMNAKIVNSLKRYINSKRGRLAGAAAAGAGNGGGGAAAQAAAAQAGMNVSPNASPATAGENVSTAIIAAGGNGNAAAAGGAAAAQQQAANQGGSMNKRVANAIATLNSILSVNVNSIPKTELAEVPKRLRVMLKRAGNSLPENKRARANAYLANVNARLAATMATAAQVQRPNNRFKNMNINTLVAATKKNLANNNKAKLRAAINAKMGTLNENSMNRVRLVNALGNLN